MRKRSIFVAAGMAAATIIGAMSPATPASAGDPIDVDVSINVVGPDPAGTLAGLTLELWDVTDIPELLTGDPGPCGDPNLDTFPTDGVFGYAQGQCDLQFDHTYAIGLDGVPEGMTVSGYCQTRTNPQLELLDGDAFEFTVDRFVYDVDCYIDLIQPLVIVDKIVDSGTAESGDFTIEVYDDGGTEVATGTDTSADSCDEFGDLTGCLVIPLAGGTYQLGESGPDGYVASNVGCRTAGGQILLEAFPAGIGEFTISGDPTTEIDAIAVCEITNDYYEGDLVVTKSVTNDDGGLLGPDDFTAEIYTEPGGSLVASGECDAEGACLTATSLPIGDYRIGEADAQGYTASVTCSVTRNPDGPGDITTTPPTTELRQNEAIAGDDAVATVEPFGEVTCEIVNDDPTTTTTTTMAPTTTDQDGGANVPTTVAPILPPTGDDNGTMAIIATLLIAVGGALLVARRRIA